ncbi:hypothetical protein BG003_004945 [Podila horticola]|nr:hypothetical protein BG003_004945 [Podila horticola]
MEPNLTPILWELYVDCIHDDIVERRAVTIPSHLIRRMEITVRYEGLVQATNLRAFSINSEECLQHCADLIRANPHLEYLLWTTRLQILNSAVQQDMQQAIVSLNRLQTLFLGWTPLRFNHLAQILHNNRNFHDLNFTDCSGLHLVPQPQDPEDYAQQDKLCGDPCSNLAEELSQLAALSCIGRPNFKGELKPGQLWEMYKVGAP